MCLAVSLIPIVIIGGTQGFQASFWFLLIIFTVTFAFSMVISYFIARPLVKLTKNIDKLSKGELDVNLENSEIYEINNLTESLNRIMASLKLAIHKVGVKKGEIFEDAVKAKEAFEKKQTDIFDSIKGWAWETDTRGIYTFCSNNIYNALGYKPEEIIGKSIFEFIDSEDAKKVRNAFDNAGKKKIPIKDLENWNITKNGEKIYVLTNCVPYFDEEGNLAGYRGVDTDITFKKEYDEKTRVLGKELSTLKAKITELLNERDQTKPGKLLAVKAEKTIDEKWSEHEFDSVFIFDEHANILDCNENMYKRLGYSKSELLSLNMADFDALETKDDIVNKIKKAKKEGVISFKTIHKRKDGSAILVHENFQYLKDKNAFKCIVREDYTVKKSS